MKRFKSDGNIDVPEIIDKDQSSWKFKSESSLNYNPAQNKITNQQDEEKQKEANSKNMDHSTSQLNLLKLQHQQISNQVTQLELHLSTISQIDNDSDEVLNNISNIEESINTLKSKKRP